MKNLNMDTKVNADGGKAMGLKSQPITGKLQGMTSMGKGEGLGQMVKTVKSNPIQGAKNEQKGNTAMGSGSVIDPFV